MSNLFTTTGDLDMAWRDCLVAIAEHFPGLPSVAYEHGDALAAGLRNGFEATGALRVWVKGALDCICSSNRTLRRQHSVGAGL